MTDPVKPAEVVDGASTTPEVPAAPAAPVADPQPTPGSEADTNPAGNEGKAPQSVPFERFQEVNNKAKEAAEKAEKAEAEIARIRSAFAPEATSQPSEIDPEAEKILADWAKQRGFVTKEELDAEAGRRQYDTDVADLKQQFGDKFDPDAVTKFAVENMGVKNRQALEAAFFYMNKDSFLEDAKKAALEEAKNPTAFAEKPGPGGSKAPEAETPKSGDPIKSRVRAALGRIQG